MTDILPRLTREEERTLLDLARRAIAARLGSAPPPRLEDPSPRLLRPQGAFVSLHSGRRLRGCVGIVLPERPLAETVIGCAAAAATEDPRFDALGIADLEGVTIEISALDPPFRVTDPSQLTLGTHGLMVTLGRRRGLLLPQVALDQGWDLRTFLEETCLKAGLPPEAWTRGAVVEAFSAQVFSERDPASH
jgi:AmmeMemoRadiSam system protein A